MLMYMMGGQLHPCLPYGSLILLHLCLSSYLMWLGLGYHCFANIIDE